MKTFYITNKFLGTKKHLMVTEDQFVWVDYLEHNSWTLDKDIFLNKSILYLSNLIGINEDFKIPLKYQNMCKTLSVSNISPFSLLPRHAFKSWLLEVCSRCRSVLKHFETDKYKLQIEKHMYIHQRISSCAINPKLYSKYKDLDDKNVISNFKSCELLTRKPEYRKIDTGRLTIKSGGNILILKKEFRNMFESTYNDGRLVMIDYNSLEPRVAASLANHSISKEDDVYESIDKKIYDQLGRSNFKILTMSILYGMSLRNLKNKWPDVENISEIYRAVTRHFKVNTVCRDIEREGKVYTPFGWKLKKSKHKSIYSHYVQSVGSDVCLSGFYNLIKILEEQKAKIKPVWLLHDALILDVHPGSFSILKNSLHVMTKNEVIKSAFPVKISLFR